MAKAASVAAARRRNPLVRAAAAGFLILAVLLPRPAAAQCGTPAAYTVQRGDTLYAIARRAGTSIQALASLNRLANANRIYVGQVLTLREGDCPEAPPGGQYVVQRGDSLSRIAARYGTTVTALAAANRIANPSLIYVGQTLAIPGANPNPTPPPPAALADLRLAPGLPEQGRTLLLSLPADGVSAVTATLGPWSVRFFQEGNRYFGLAGIYALADAGAYTLALNVTDAAGQVTAYSQSVRVGEGGYARESIRLSDSKSQLLDPRLTVPEAERIAAVVSPVTPARYWRGLFRLPAAGRVTSFFGTRRSYNGGPYRSYHGGVDFSFAGGDSIWAPAPGVVVLAEPLTVRGNATIIDHGWGVYSGFWHQAEVLVSAGDWVETGHLIGRIGDTGLTTGPHLHWEMFVGGVQVDPIQWTRQAIP